MRTALLTPSASALRLQLRGHVPLHPPQGGRAGAAEGRDVPGAGALSGRLVQGHLHAHGQDWSFPRELHEPSQQVPFLSNLPCSFTIIITTVIIIIIIISNCQIMDRWWNKCGHMSFYLYRMTRYFSPSPEVSPAVSPCRSVQGSSQPKVPLSLSTQAGRGVGIISSAAVAAAVPGPDSNKPVAVGPAPTAAAAAAVPANSQPAASATAATAATVAQTATGQQPKIPLHLSSQMTVNQARNAVRTGQFRQITSLH